MNKVNGRFKKGFSNPIFFQCVDRDVGFFEAWVSVFDGGLNQDCRLRQGKVGKVSRGKVSGTNGTVVIVSYFRCSVYRIRLLGHHSASALEGNRDGGV